MATASQDALQAAYVDFSEITLGEKLGHGSYGVVYKAIWRNQQVAVKEFFASADEKDIEKEVKQLSRVKHPNIISLHVISAFQQATYLVMEYAEGGSLHNFLHGKVKPAYTLSHAISWALQCAEGVAHLHGMSPKPLIHRDLKPLNLLLTNKGRNLKICDFGTVVDKSTMMTNNRGSAAWMAPEVFEGSKYTEKCDIFSWAIILWEVLSRKQPFRDIDNAYTIQWKIYKGERPPLLDNCPPRIEKLMTDCWETQPEVRPSMKYIVGVMNEIIKDYVGADKALEYTYVNQQIVTKDSDGTVAAPYDSLNHDTSDMSMASTQLTPTNVRGTATEFGTGTGTGSASGTGSGSGFSNNENTSSERTPTNSGQLDNNGKFKLGSSNRWDAIPEEDSCDSQINECFNLRSSAEAEKRLETIRNDMMANANIKFDELVLDVEPNGFDLSRSESNSSSSIHAKSDGRERLTVTDTKPVIMPSPTTDLSNNNNNGNNNNNNNSGPYNNSRNNNERHDNNGPNHATRDHIPPDDVNAEEDTDVGYGIPEQSYADILDPDLQPEPPIPNDAESQAIYRAHRLMAKDYLLVDSHIYYTQDLKDKVIQEMDGVEREKKLDLLSKMKDKEDLQVLYNNLQQQRNKLPPARRVRPTVPGGDSVENDGWVVIAPPHNT